MVVARDDVHHKEHCLEAVVDVVPEATVVPTAVADATVEAVPRTVEAVPHTVAVAAILEAALRMEAAILEAATRMDASKHPLNRDASGPVQASSEASGASACAGGPSATKAAPTD